MRHYLYSFSLCTIAFLSISLIACSNKQENKKTTSEVISPKEFTMVDIPVMLVSPEDRANYLVKHYWNNFDFTDTAYIHFPDITEQAMVNFIDIFPLVEDETVYNAINHTLILAEQKSEMQAYFLELYKKYLHDPNSPLRNEDYYIPVLNYILSSTHLDKATISKAQYLLDLIKKNRVGDKATDITYTLMTGKKGTLYQLNTDFIILMFYNPDCHTCSETIDYLKMTTLINNLLKEKRLSILAFYPDADLAVWKKYSTDIPTNWINGYDERQTVENNKLYDLKAIPTLYLLDKNKNVLLKDAGVHTIGEYLWQHVGM